jgi:hypothetical protein
LKQPVQIRSWGKTELAGDILKGLSLFTTPLLTGINEDLTVEPNLIYHNNSFCQHGK